MDTPTTRSYLTCYDYGTGGVWLLLEATSHEAAQRAYPNLIVFETRPEWMSDQDEIEYRADCERIGFHWNVEVPPTGWLKNYIDRETSKE